MLCYCWLMWCYATADWCDAMLLLTDVMLCYCWLMWCYATVDWCDAMLLLTDVMLCYCWQRCTVLNRSWDAGCSWTCYNRMQSPYPCGLASQARGMLPHWCNMVQVHFPVLAFVIKWYTLKLCWSVLLPKYQLHFKYTFSFHIITWVFKIQNNTFMHDTSIQG